MFVQEKGDSWALVDSLKVLAREYVTDVASRLTLGDAHAAYHARLPKIEAYGLMLTAGYAPTFAVAMFDVLGQEVVGDGIILQRVDREGRRVALTARWFPAGAWSFETQIEWIEVDG